MRVFLDQSFFDPYNIEWFSNKPEIPPPPQLCIQLKSPPPPPQVTCVCVRACVRACERAYVRACVTDIVMHFGWFGGRAGNKFFFWFCLLHTCIIYITILFLYLIALYLEPCFAVFMQVIYTFSVSHWTAHCAFDLVWDYYYSSLVWY